MALATLNLKLDQLQRPTSKGHRALVFPGMSLQLISQPGSASAGLRQPNTAARSSRISHRKPPLLPMGGSNDRIGKSGMQSSVMPTHDRRLSDHMKRTSRNQDAPSSKNGLAIVSSAIHQPTYGTNNSEDQRTAKNAGPNSKPEEKPQEGRPVETRPQSLRQKSSRVSTLSTIQEEERRKNRRDKFNEFLTSVWGPALRDEFAGAYRLANTGDQNNERAQDPRVIEERNRAAKLLEKKANANINQETKQEIKQEIKQETKQETKRKSAKERQDTKTRPTVNTMKSLPVIDIAREVRETSQVLPKRPVKVEAEVRENHTSRKRASNREDDWAQSVQQVLEQTTTRISNEALNDPDFIKKRRESAQMRAWLATHKRASQARLSALETGRILPSSAFEKAFVAEVLRENEESMKRRTTSFMQPGQSSNFSSKRSTLLPDYTPFTHYSLLMPLEEIESEARQAEDIEEKEQTVFEKRKAARRAGQEYKSFSRLTMNDQDTHGSQCCDLNIYWKKLGFLKGQ